jgi:GDSL-like Lipase/Acylhydrolase family
MTLATRRRQKRWTLRLGTDLTPFRSEWTCKFPSAILLTMSSGSRAVACLLLTSVLAMGILGASESSAFAGSRSQRALVTSRSYPWKGNHSTCQIKLPEPNGIVSIKDYNTCPPKRVLLIGDSVGLTMGIQMAINQQNYGTLIDTEAYLGCGFVTGYERNFTGAGFASSPPECDQATTNWAAAERQFKAQAVVVELGWWDSEPHLVNGTTQSLGEPSYDALVSQGITSLIQQLRAKSNVPIYFLSVPWMSPAPWPNGQQNPGATAASHQEINALIQAASQSASNVHFIDVSPYITPSGHYQLDVGGQVCRDSEGIHLYTTVSGSTKYVSTKCGQALQKGVFSTIRSALAK